VKQLLFFQLKKTCKWFFIIANLSILIYLKADIEMCKIAWHNVFADSRLWTPCIPKRNKDSPGTHLIRRITEWPISADDRHQRSSIRSSSLPFDRLFFPYLNPYLRLPFSFTLAGEHPSVAINANRVGSTVTFVYVVIFKMHKIYVNILLRQTYTMINIRFRILLL